MDITELLNLFADTGFPVVVTAYLLVKLEKQLTALTSSITKLSTLISIDLNLPIDNDKNNK